MDLTADQVAALHTAITAIFAAIGIVAVYLAHRALGAKLSRDQLDMLDKVLNSVLAYAEEQSHKAATGLLAEGPRTPAQKLEVAKSAARSIAPKELAHTDDRALEVLLEAKLQQQRPTSSHPPARKTLPPVRMEIR